MIVKINTELLQEMSAIATRASQAAVDASSILEGVVSHDDWYCKEKLSIDSGVKAVKSNALRIKEGVEAVSSYVVATAAYLVEMIQQEERELSGIDSELAAISSLLDGPGGSVVSSGKNVNQACGELRNASNNVAVMNYLSSADKPISVMEYI